MTMIIPINMILEVFNYKLYLRYKVSFLILLGLLQLIFFFLL